MWKFWIRGNSASVSINRKYFGSERPTFRKLFSTSWYFLLWWIELLFFFRSIKEEEDREHANDEDGGRVILAPCHVISVLVMTWLQNFSSPDKVSLSGRNILGPNSDLIYSNISSPSGRCGWSEILLEWWWCWILILSPLITSWTLHCGSGPSFCKARSGKKKHGWMTWMMRHPFLDTYSGWRDRDAIAGPKAHYSSFDDD